MVIFIVIGFMVFFSFGLYEDLQIRQEEKLFCESKSGKYIGNISFKGPGCAIMGEDGIYTKYELEYKNKDGGREFFLIK